MATSKNDHVEIKLDRGRVLRVGGMALLMITVTFLITVAPFNPTVSSSISTFFDENRGEISSAFSYIPSLMIALVVGLVLGLIVRVLLLLIDRLN